MLAVDTNMLVRLLARDDEQQTLAAEAFVEKGAWVSHLVLMETVWVLDSVYGLNSTQLISAIEMLLQHRDLSLQESDTIEAALSLFRHSPSIGFSDCLTLEVARRAGHLPLGTFDVGLSRLPGAQRVKA